MDEQPWKWYHVAPLIWEAQRRSDDGLVILCVESLGTGQCVFSVRSTPPPHIYKHDEPLSLSRAQQAAEQWWREHQ